MYMRMKDKKEAAMEAKKGEEPPSSPPFAVTEPDYSSIRLYKDIFFA